MAATTYCACGIPGATFVHGNLCASCYNGSETQAMLYDLMKEQANKSLQETLAGLHSTEYSSENFQRAFAGFFGDTPEVKAIWDLAYCLALDKAADRPIAPDPAEDSRRDFNRARELFFRILDKPERIERYIEPHVDEQRFGTLLEALQKAADFVRAMLDAAGYEIRRTSIVNSDETYASLARSDRSLSIDHANALTRASRDENQVDPNLAENLRWMSGRDNNSRGDRFTKEDQRIRPVDPDREELESKAALAMVAEDTKRAKELAKEAGSYCTQCSTLSKNLTNGVCQACLSNREPAEKLA
jgi:hypothetical protein